MDYMWNQTTASLFEYWVILHAFLSSVDFFFKKETFSKKKKKKSYRNTIIVSNSWDPEMLGLIWVQTVCKDYQQTTKVTTSGLRVNP